ncbi:MAG: hypothetical protein HY555_03680 [Euryarchaeota archaeon]|nr:hypothetical protein [Euryarchaeota archaeon]
MEPRGLSGPVTISAAAILLAVALLTTYTATAIPAGWSGDTQLTNTTAYSEVPELAIDGSGNIHIIYAENGVPYYAKLSPDGSPALTKRLTDRSPAAFESGIAVDPLDNIHLVWRDKTTRYNIVYKRLNPSGSTAVDETQATFGSGDMPSLAVDPNGNPSIVYSLPTAGSPGSGLGYTKLDTIGKTVISQKVITDTFYENWGPAAAVDPLSNAHIAWSDLRNGTYAIYYSKLDLNGRVLVNASKVSGGGGQSTNPLDMALDSKENIYITWVDDRDGNWEVYYAKLGPSGAVLMGDTRLTNDSAASWKPRIAVGSDDSLHIAWEDERDGNKELYYKRLDSNGTIMVDETRLTYNLATSQNPDIAVDSTGVVHIVWEQDREIYYKKSVP